MSRQITLTETLIILHATKPHPIIVLLYIVSGENKHGNERIDLLENETENIEKNVVAMSTIDANEYRIL